MTGGRMNGAMPSIWNTCAQGAMPPPQKPGQRKGDADRQGSRQRRQRPAMPIMRPRHAGIGEDPRRTSAAKSRPAERPASCFALTETPATTISGAARNSATSPKQNAAEQSAAHVATLPPSDQKRQSHQRQRHQHQEHRHRRGERHVGLVDRLVRDQHRQRPVLRPAEHLRQQIRAQREDEHHDQGRDDGVAQRRHDDVEEGA